VVPLGEGGLVKADWSSVAATVMRTISGYAETWGAILPPIIIIATATRARWRRQ